MGRNGPNLNGALAWARRITEELFADDSEVRLLGVTRDRDTEHSFGIEVTTKHGTRTVYVVAKKDTWSYDNRHYDNPETDRILVKAGYCLDFSSRYGAKEKTRNIPLRKDGTFNDKSVRKAIRESVELVKDDLERRAERARQETASQDAQTAVRDAIEREHKGTFDDTDTWGRVDLPHLTNSDHGTIKVLPGGHVTIELGYLSQEDALEVLHRLTNPEFIPGPKPDTRRAHERFPDQFEEVEGQPGTYKYVPKGKA